VAVRAMHKCHDCKETFRTEDMINYASAGAKTSYWYCKECYNNKIERENFSNKVCEIFGLKAPGAQIWTERKRLRNTYGYSDNILVECLDYLYKVEKKKKLVDSLTLIKPATVEKMLDWKKHQSNKAEAFIRAINTQTTEYIVPIKENKSTKQILNADDFLQDEE